MFNKIVLIATIAIAAANAKDTSNTTAKLVKSVAKKMVAKAKPAPKKIVAKPSSSFGDLSFLNNESAYKAAEAARMKFITEHMRLAAKRKHETFAYFKAHHHAGWTKKVMD